MKHMRISGYGNSYDIYQRLGKDGKMPEQAAVQKGAAVEGQTNHLRALDNVKSDEMIKETDNTGNSESVQHTYNSTAADNNNNLQERRKNSDIQDFTFDFKKNDFNLVGARSKVEDLDVEKALSDMKKDGVLDQYKFFVKTALVNNEDGTVRQVIRPE